MYLTTLNFFLFLLNTKILKLESLFFINHLVLLHLFLTLFEVMNSLNIAQFCNFIFLGDFNINYNDPSHHLYSKLCNISHFLNLTQVVTGSTHTSPHGNPSLIYLAFMSSPCQLLDCYVIPPIANSDHNGLKIRVNWKPGAQSPRPGQNTRTIWHYAHADFDKARDLIHNTEWAPM